MSLWSPVAILILIEYTVMLIWYIMVPIRVKKDYKDK